MSNEDIKKISSIFSARWNLPPAIPSGAKPPSIDVQTDTDWHPLLIDRIGIMDRFYLGAAYGNSNLIAVVDEGQDSIHPTLFFIQKLLSFPSSVETPVKQLQINNAEIENKLLDVSNTCQGKKVLCGISGFHNSAICKQEAIYLLSSWIQSHSPRSINWPVCNGIFQSQSDNFNRSNGPHSL